MANDLTCNSKKPFTVIVEGNIGSGKTTFLEYFRKFVSVNVLSEPVELWQNCSGHNLLKYMYEDPKRWAPTFESYVLLTMSEHHNRQTTQPIKLMERSIFSARYCFIEKMHHDGLLSQPSMTILDELFKHLYEQTKVSVDLIVYLRTSPEIVFERIHKRNRAEEKSVSFDYIKDLHEFHENWLYRKTIFHCPAPIITLNGDLDKSVINSEYEKCEPSILKNVFMYM